MNIPRTIYVVETEKGDAVTASTVEQEAREHGEDLQEFDPANRYYLESYTLH